MCIASASCQTPWPLLRSTQTTNVSAETRRPPRTAPWLESWTSAPVKTVSLHLFLLWHPSSTVLPFCSAAWYFFQFVLFLCRLKQKDLSTSPCPTSSMAVRTYERPCWASIPARCTTPPTWMWNL